MRRHTGARPYHCGVCPARFIQSGQLKVHRMNTGHWMETQPDLKGGHRVEPVVPLTNPTPIKFKKHGKNVKKDAEKSETKPQVLEPSVQVIEHETQVQVIIEDSERILEQIQNEAIDNFATDLAVTAQNNKENAVDDKNRIFPVNNVKFESADEDKVQSTEESSTFQSFSTVQSTATTFTLSEAYNYQSFN